METLQKLHREFIKMLIRKCGIGIGEDTEEYIIFRAKEIGVIRFFLDKFCVKPKDPCNNTYYVKYDYELKLKAYFSSLYDTSYFDNICAQAYSSVFIPEEYLRRLDSTYHLARNHIYVLPNMPIYSNNNIEKLFIISKNGIRKYQSVDS